MCFVLLLGGHFWILSSEHGQMKFGMCSGCLWGVITGELRLLLGV